MSAQANKRSWQMQTYAKTFLLILTLMIFASNASAADRVLTIYFAGTGMTWNDHAASSSPWNRPELLAALYKTYDNSVAIEHGPYDGIYGYWPPLEITNNDATHFKYFINGAGTSSLTMSLTPELRWIDLLALLGTANPNLGTRIWHNMEAEALNGLIMLLNKHPSDQVILNLVGFSRGGISAMRVAHSAAAYANVKKINILAFDPVPGDLDPVFWHGQYFILDPKVNQYVGIYAEDERSYPFEPVIPKKTFGSNTSILLVRTPGSHETMMGNLQTYGHSVGLNLSGVLGETYGYRVVGEVSQVFVEQLLTSDEWGTVPLTTNKTMYVTGGVDTQIEFATMVTEMWNIFDQVAPWHPTYHAAIQQTGFVGPLFGGRDLFYTVLNKGHELRVPTLISIEKRLVFVGDERRPFGGWVWGYGFPGAFVFNSEVVYWLEDRAPRINASTWDTLQAFRGNTPSDMTSPIPNIAVLAAIEGQCSVTISDPPKATDNIDGVLEGTTENSLIYSEQGEYTITWTYTDSSQNISTQSQQVIVKDSLAPVPDTDDPATDDVIEGFALITGQCSAAVIDPPTATDNCSGPVVGTTTDPLDFNMQGEHQINWLFTDDFGNQTTQTQTLVVQDTVAPEIDTISASPSILWPPNNKMSLVVIEVVVADNCDAAPVCRIESVSSNASERRSRSWNRQGDWQIMDEHSVNLRAEKNRIGSERIYTVVDECLDAAGNSSIDVAVVTVPHDQGKDQ
jgi:hypothetical protein